MINRSNQRNMSEGTQQHQVSKPQELHGLSPDLLLGHAPPCCYGRAGGRSRRRFWSLGKTWCWGNGEPPSSVILIRGSSWMGIDFHGFSSIFMDLLQQVQHVQYVPSIQPGKVNTSLQSLPKSTWWPGHGKFPQWLHFGHRGFRIDGQEMTSKKNSKPKNSMNK